MKAPLQRPPGSIPDPYRCPKCSEPMAIGQVVLNSSGWSLFFVGLSLSKLDFIRSDQHPTRLLDQGETKTAYRCKACEIVAIGPR